MSHGVCRRARTELRDACGDPFPSHDWRGRRRYVHGAGSRWPRGTWESKFLASPASPTWRPVLPQPLNHEEVLETARRVRGAFIGLLEGIIERL